MNVESKFINGTLLQFIRRRKLEYFPSGNATVVTATTAAATITKTTATAATLTTAGVVRPQESVKINL